MSRIVDKTWVKFRQLHKNVNAHVGRSIMYGSLITGAPGQPVQKGDLLASWREEVLGEYHSRWISRLIYAPIIEDNRRGAQLRSKVGGFHSVKMTRHGYPLIVRHEMRLLNTGQVFDPSGRGSRYRDPKTGRWA